ncbi:MAG: hypothetical protein ABH821_05945 [archaeon]
MKKLMIFLITLIVLVATVSAIGINFKNNGEETSFQKFTSWCNQVEIQLPDSLNLPGNTYVFVDGNVLNDSKFELQTVDVTVDFNTPTFQEDFTIEYSDTVPEYGTVPFNFHGTTINTMQTMSSLMTVNFSFKNLNGGTCEKSKEVEIRLYDTDLCDNLVLETFDKNFYSGQQFNVLIGKLYNNTDYTLQVTGFNLNVSAELFTFLDLEYYTWIYPWLVTDLYLEGDAVETLDDLTGTLTTTIYAKVNNQDCVIEDEATVWVKP